MVQKPSNSKKLWSTVKRRYGFIGSKKVVVGFFVLVAGVIIGVLLLSQTTQGTMIVRQQSTSPQNDRSDSQGDATEGKVTTQATEATKTGDPKKPSSVVVYVDGAVVTPGMYTLAQDIPRIYDALDAAGGPTDEADISEMNLAKPIKDGDKIHVPQKGEKQPSSSENAAESSSKAPETPVVNINTATEEELTNLPGVGKSMAKTILKDREKNGPFATPEDLMRVSGIGEKKFERMKEYVCVS